MRCFVFLVLYLAAGGACAQFAMPWHRAPGISVIGAAADDPRRSLVEEAVAFWNKTLQELGSGFRLGAVAHVTQAVPEEALQEMSAGFLRGAPTPLALRGLPADLTVMLAHSAFISFAGPFDSSGRKVVGIRGIAGSPLDLPNVARNVIAHEIGHAIGLGHNADPSMLMCGRPASCRPDAFQSDQPRYFPLHENDKRRLLLLYPPDWKPSAPQ